MIDRAGYSRIAVAILLCLAFVARLAADEPLPTIEDDKPAAPAKTESKEPVPADPLDQKLRKSLDQTASEEIERIERAIEGMRAAGQRIEARDVGEKTLAVQRQVIDDLSKLLQLLKQRQQNQQNQRQNQKQQPNSNPDQNQQQNDSSDPRQGPQSANSSVPKPRQQTEAEKSREARERSEAARRGAAEDERQKMVKDVWGHLPPHLREAMLNSFSEKYLPKYEDLVKRYYEALAERNRNRSAK